MKKIILLALTFLFLIICVVGLVSCDKETEDNGDVITLNVYNWGEYMPLDEDEDGYATNREFEKWYEEKYGQKIKVNYDTYSSNEELRAKLEANAVSYDIIIPSDYMVDYFVKHDLLCEINSCEDQAAARSSQGLVSCCCNDVSISEW